MATSIYVPNDSHWWVEDDPWFIEREFNPAVPAVQDGLEASDAYRRLLGGEEDPREEYYSEYDEYSA